MAEAKTKKSHKKLIIILCAIVVILAVVYFAWGREYITRHYSEVNVNLDEATDLSVPIEGSTLVVYFTRVGNSNFTADTDAVASASLMRDGDRLIGNSELIAETIKTAVNGDIYAISVADKYPASYAETTSVARKELNGEVRVTLAGDIKQVAGYDNVFMVFPIWWGEIPQAVKQYVSSQSFEGVNLYCVVAHGGSKEGSCITELESLSGVKVLSHIAVYDKDAATSKAQIEQWLKEIAGK